MQALFDLLPVLAFFAAYKVSGLFVADSERIYVATATLIVCTLLQVLVQWLRTRKVSKMLLISAVLVMLFGGLTLWVHDDRFIVWKPTLVYVLFAIAMLLSPLVSGKPLVQHLLEHQMSAPARVWYLTNLHYTGLWFVLAGINAVFVLYFSRDAWVIWHTATAFLVPAFGLLQGLWLMRHIQPVTPDSPAP